MQEPTAFLSRMVRSGALCLLLVSLVTPACDRPASSSGALPDSGVTRTYFIAADDLDWDYAPSGMDRVHGTRYRFQDDPGSVGTLDPNNTVYRKTLFREYTDETFRTLKPRSAAWEHLGMLGPLIRAEVGDTIRITFRNNASRPYSMHPHGVSYAKNAEGAAYQDGTSGVDRDDDAVVPGGTHVYVWGVPERAGPTGAEGSTAFWLYHSHVDEGRDINTGLIGPLLVARRGMARPDGSPTDVDREFVAQFGVQDEHLSWHWDANATRIYGRPRDYAGDSERVLGFQHFWTINGFMDANGPIMSMRSGERVRWYLFATPNDEHLNDLHTAHWHGQTVVISHMRMDMAMLTPMATIVADMAPDNPGTWFFHCHMPGHFMAGMRTVFEVVAP